MENIIITLVIFVFLYISYGYSSQMYQRVKNANLEGTSLATFEIDNDAVCAIHCSNKPSCVGFLLHTNEVKCSLYDTTTSSLILDAVNIKGKVYVNTVRAPEMLQSMSQTSPPETTTPEESMTANELTVTDISGWFGTWRENQQCSVNSYVNKVTVWALTFVSRVTLYDDYGITGIDVYCATKDGFNINSIFVGDGFFTTSAEAPIACPEGSFAYGYRIAIQNEVWANLDNVGMAGIELQCDDDDQTILSSKAGTEITYIGLTAWSLWARCNPGMVLCGFKPKIDVRIFDVTAVNEVAGICCIFE